MDAVTISRSQGVMTLRLGRPAKKNALTRAMYQALTEGLDEADGDDTIHAVVICAHGPDFCAGNDIFDFAQGLSQMQAGDIEDQPVFRFLKALTFFGKPLIAAVQGQAVGVGVTLLLHCDLVVVSDDVQLKLPFLQLGLVPEAGSTLLLPQRIGHARAFEWLTQGRAVRAQQALDWGLANRVVSTDDLISVATDLAQGLAGVSPAALRHTKALMREPEDIWRVVRAEAEIFRNLLSSPQTLAAFTAFMSRS